MKFARSTLCIMEFKSPWKIIKNELHYSCPCKHVCQCRESGVCFLNLDCSISSIHSLFTSYTVLHNLTNSNFPNIFDKVSNKKCALIEINSNDFYLLADDNDAGLQAHWRYTWFKRLFKCVLKPPRSLRLTFLIQDKTRMQALNLYHINSYLITIKSSR